MRRLFRSIWAGRRSYGAGLVVLAVLTAVLSVVSMGGVYVVSQSSRFCATCHYMAPYYRQWQSSSHSEVACVSCHPVRPLTVAVSAIRYFTGTQQARPRAEVADQSCLQAGCHQDRLVNGGQVFEEKIHFEHAPHMEKLRRGKRLHCTSCHSQIVQGEHISVTKETCFLCHFKGVGEAQAVGGCTNCHGTPSKTVEHEGFVFSHDSYLKVGVSCQECHIKITEGDGEVPFERCYTCHVERMERYEDSEFIHNTHVTDHDIDCFRCHEQIGHGGVEMIRALEPSCENCHRSLHSAQKEMYLGAGGEGVADTPSRMMAAHVSCDGCHTRVVHLGTPEFDEISLEAQRQSCVICHGEGYDHMLDDWLREMDRLVQLVAPEVEGAEAALAEAALAPAQGGAGTTTQARVLIEKARHNLDFLKYGHGAHNVEYAVRLGQAAVGFVDEGMAKLGAAYQPPERPPLLTTDDAYCTTLCHARLGLPEETGFDHLVFPHALHVEDVEVPCTDCHSPEKHKMQIITRSECMSCHHEAQDIDCAHCHLQQEQLYTGQIDADEEGTADFMAAEEVECVECHDLSDTISVVEIQQVCVDCHEAGYDEMLTEWMTEIQHRLAEVTVLADQVAQKTARPGRGTRRASGEAETQLRRARELMAAVEQGKGAHNYELSLSVLEQAEERLTRALELAEGR